MANYNILNEPWISVLRSDGRPSQMSLLEVLEHSHNLQCVAESTPLATYSVLRLLIGFLLDAYRPQTVDDLLELEKPGRVDMEALGRYIHLCEAEGVSFDLFDKDRPFLQSVYDPSLDGKKPNGAAQLIYHMPSGTNQTMFGPGHLLEKDTVLSVPSAFKGLLTYFCFLGTGGAGYFSNLTGAPCMYIMIEGNNLFETLIRNIPLSEYVGIGYDHLPILWRHKEKIDRSDIENYSFLFGYLCPSRRLQLLPSKEKGSTVVRSCWFSPGHKFTNKDDWQDPHMAYFYDKKDRRRAVTPVHGRKVWQDIGSIITHNETHIPPQNIMTFKEALDERKINDPVLRLRITSFITGAHCTNYEAMQESELRLPTKLLTDPNRLPLVMECVQFAEEKGKRLRFALRTACNLRTAKDSDKVVFQRIIDEAQNNYMYCAEKLFYELLDIRMSEEKLDIPAITEEWQKSIQDAAAASYDRHFERFRMSGRKMYESYRCRGMLFNRKEKKKEEL